MSTIKANTWLNTDGTENFKISITIPKDEEIPYGFRLGRKLQKDISGRITKCQQ